MLPLHVAQVWAYEQVSADIKATMQQPWDMGHAAAAAHQLQILARDALELEEAVDQVGGQVQRLRHELEGGHDTQKAQLAVPRAWHRRRPACGFGLSEEGTPRLVTAAVRLLAADAGLRGRGEARGRERAHLELQVHLHQPVDQDGAHLVVDVSLQEGARQDERAPPRRAPHGAVLTEAQSPAATT